MTISCVNSNWKVTAEHLKKTAYLYIRQSTQGLVICGKCGRAMTLRYHLRGGRLSPNYICQKQYIEQCRPVCQDVPGSVVDDALSALILQSVSPLALEVALNVQEELQKRLAESDRLRRQYGD